eukprot:Gb_22096 [translate_table: standard]
MGRTPCCSKVGLNRGPWTPEEDDLLTKYIETHGEGGWRTLPKKAGLLRCGKSCRLRWMNYLRPDVKRGQISPDEEDLILRLHRLLGNRWSLIAGRMPGRTDNEIKNYWNTHLSKKLVSQGIDPRTHKPLPESEVDADTCPFNNSADQEISNDSLKVNSQSLISEHEQIHPENLNGTSVSREVSEETAIGAPDNTHPCNSHEPTKLVSNGSDLIPQTSNPHVSVSFSDNLYDGEANLKVHSSLNSSAKATHMGVASAATSALFPLYITDPDKGINQADSFAVSNQPLQLPCGFATSSGVGAAADDCSSYLRTNSVTNSYYMAPPAVTEARSLHRTPFIGHSESSSVAKSAFSEGHDQFPINESFAMNFEQSDMRQRSVNEEAIRVSDGNRTIQGTASSYMLPIAPLPVDATGEDCNSDIFSLFLESFMTNEELLNEHYEFNSVPSASQNVQPQSETTNLSYNDLWPLISPPSRYLSN